MKRPRPPLFALMLWAFVTVIVLGFCGMGMVFVLATRVSNPEAGPPSMTAQRTALPLPLPPIHDGTPITMPSSPSNSFQDGDHRSSFDWRGPVSALLAFAAVLLGAATFFSSRLARPLTRLTRAARTMTEGDLSVRVSGSAVREIDELAGAFNIMASSLSEADRQRRQMTADVAHELRTPLAIIRGRLEGIQDGVYSATPDEISTLLNETALLERLIEDLRILALADAGQLPIHVESIAPASLLRSVAHSFAQKAQHQGVKLHMADLQPLPEVEADPQRIAQVLGNLVANSLAHTPAGGAIVLNAWVSAQGPGTRGNVSSSPSPPPSPYSLTLLCISVSDTGYGIPQADLPHIFDRFYRADPARTRAGGGAGLGLAIAKRIVEAHHGQIWAQSVLGQGTTVAFCLPIRFED